MDDDENLTENTALVWGQEQPASVEYTQPDTPTGEICLNKFFTVGVPVDDQIPRR